MKRGSDDMCLSDAALEQVELQHALHLSDAAGESPKRQKVQSDVSLNLSDAVENELPLNLSDAVETPKKVPLNVSDAVETPKEVPLNLSDAVETPKEVPLNLSDAVETPKKVPLNVSDAVETPKEVPLNLSDAVETPKEVPLNLSDAVETPKEVPLNLSDAVETPKKVPLNLSDAVETPKKKLPPTNPNRFLSPHKFTAPEARPQEGYIAILLRCGILMEGDVLVCEGVRGRLTANGGVIEEDDFVEHKSVPRFVSSVIVRTAADFDELKWFFRVHVLNVGIQSFSTRIGVCLSELFELLAK